jgi:hypothetical protein
MMGSMARNIKEIPKNLSSKMVFSPASALHARKDREQHQVSASTVMVDSNYFHLPNEVSYGNCAASQPSISQGTPHIISTLSFGVSNACNQQCLCLLIIGNETRMLS